MPRAKGFLTNASARTLSTTYQAVNLTAASATDANATVPMPASGHVSHIEFDVDTIAGGATALQFLVTWAATFTQVFFGPTASTAWAVNPALATAAAISPLIDRDYRIPAAGIASQITVWVRVDAGTANLAAGAIRLHFLDGPTA